MSLLKRVGSFLLRACFLGRVDEPPAFLGPGSLAWLPLLLPVSCSARSSVVCYSGRKPEASWEGSPASLPVPPGENLLIPGEPLPVSGSPGFENEYSPCRGD